MLRAKAKFSLAVLFHFAGKLSIHVDYTYAFTVHPDLTDSPYILYSTEPTGRIFIWDASATSLSSSLASRNVSSSKYGRLIRRPHDSNGFWLRTSQDMLVSSPDYLLVLSKNSNDNHPEISIQMKGLKTRRSKLRHTQVRNETSRFSLRKRLSPLQRYMSGLKGGSSSNYRPVTEREA